ncbi:MAG: ribbon-helix-helix domain-containing protein [Geminicoccaceae bacterium]
MIRKTMRVGEVRTSIKLEPEFWDYLKEVSEHKGIRLSALVNQVADASPERTNLASTLRTFALIHARLRAQDAQRELDQLTMAGNTEDLVRVMEACPLPCLVLNEEREIRDLNRAFALWLNVDREGAIGKRLDNIMILRGPGIKDLWRNLFDGKITRGQFNATYVSPGKVRTSQALTVPLATASDQAAKACMVLFETLAGRT